MAKARGDITINEALCTGCGYCGNFCNRDCITWPSQKFTPEGYILPIFHDAERCTACEICAWMCPTFAIEVFKHVETGSKVA